jgi:hypothetical protein
MKDKLITAGVKNLKEFGYPYCTKDNILTDMVYKEFFKSMLKDNIGKAGKKVDDSINDLIVIIENGEK